VCSLKTAVLHLNVLPEKCFTSVVHVQRRATTRTHRVHEFAVQDSVIALVVKLEMVRLRDAFASNKLVANRLMTITVTESNTKATILINHSI